jgi:GTPase SAR1 family protein
MYYRNANCAVVVYDITQTTSLEKARTWIRELQRQADPSIVIALCGNKSDLSARRQVTQEEAKKYAEEEGLMWGETSAKSGEGVSDIFTAIGANFNKFPRPVEHSCQPIQPRNCHRRQPHPKLAVLLVVAQQQVERALTSTSSRTH